jgi:Ion channel
VAVEQALSTSPARRRALVLRVSVRILVMLVVLVGTYFWLPVTAGDVDVVRVLVPVVGLTLFALVLQRQVRRIFTADEPELRALESLALVATFFVVGYAFYYVLVSAADPSSFSEPIDKMDGLYFSMTILSTVGFGDITAVSTGARALVTVQMVVDVVILGLGLRFLTRTAKVARRRRTQAAATSGDTGP